MSAADVTIRPERSTDPPAIRSLLQAAFAGDLEADLVEGLRADHALVLALVAERAGSLLGYAAFPRLVVGTPEREIAAAGLAPLAVAPPHQRRGIGSELARAGLELLKTAGESIVFVLGEPGYYTRFGFDARAGADYASPYAGPHFMALRLTGSAPRSGSVRYPGIFSRLG